MSSSVNHSLPGKALFSAIQQQTSPSGSMDHITIHIKKTKKNAAKICPHISFKPNYVHISILTLTVKSYDNNNNNTKAVKMVEKH